jgi:glutathione S-transferase
MSDMILHHYPTSPFSEKVRVAFDIKGLAWKSVIIPRILPKPDLMPLTGLRHDPAMRWMVGGKAAQGHAASPSEMG